MAFIIQISYTVRIPIFWLVDLYHVTLGCDETTSLESLSWCNSCSNFYTPLSSPHGLCWPQVWRFSFAVCSIWIIRMLTRSLLVNYREYLHSFTNNELEIFNTARGGLVQDWNFSFIVKALANEGTLLRTHCCPWCCGHKMFLNKTRNIFCVPDTKFVSAIFFVCPQQMLRAGKRGNICVGNNVSFFARAFSELV